MMQWRPLAAVGDAKLASTICFCLNHQQRLKRNESPRPELISPKDIAGKIIYTGGPLTARFLGPRKKPVLMEICTIRGVL